MKKILALTLAIFAILSMSVFASAANESTLENNGKITIDNATVGQTYTVYQMLYLESYNATASAYAYKATAEWNSFVNSDAIKGVYLNVDAEGYITAASGADFTAFAKLAKEFAAGLESNQGQTKATEATVVFENLNLGYYFLDTTLGTICSLDTTNPEVKMTDKNNAPTIEKAVKEDSTGNYGVSNTAQIGDKVEFKITVHALPGALNYVVHDMMSAGLSFNNDIAIEGLTAGTDYNVVASELEDSCTFHIEFTKAYLDGITAATDISITYSAILNNNAVVSPAANPNTAKLSYSATVGTETAEVTTNTTTFQFQFVKTDSNDIVLDGATFELYDAQTAGNKISLVKVSDGIYRIATAAEIAAEGFATAIIETVGGIATIQGVDATTTYFLEEVAAPAGYNKLSARKGVSIGATNISVTVEGNEYIGSNEVGGDAVQIINQSGSELPSTGGIGTTIFYTVGGILVIAAVVFLATKRRVSAK